MIDSRYSAAPFLKCFGKDNDQRQKQKHSQEQQHDGDQDNPHPARLTDTDGAAARISSIGRDQCHTSYAYLARLHHWSKLMRNNKTNDMSNMATANAVAPV